MYLEQGHSSQNHIFFYNFSYDFKKSDCQKGQHSVVLSIILPKNNKDKSKIEHFRPNRNTATKQVFTLGENFILEWYRYLMCTSVRTLKL